MPERADFEAALAICAAIIGAGFASGREIVSFFACFGAASFLGAAAAAAGLGALVYAIMLLAKQTHAKTLSSLYGTLMGEPCRDAISVLHGLMCLTAASAMLAAGAELGALAFPLRNSYALGFLLTLLTALAAVSMGFRTLSFMGALLIPLITVYFGAMALNGDYSLPFEAAGFLPTLPMGLIYASFNGALAAGAICTAGQRKTSPVRTAFLTALLLFLLLTLANCTLLRAGDVILQMSMPSVVLAAKWGVFGYYASIIILWLALLSTLCAMLHSLTAQLTDAGCRQTIALLISTLGTALIAVCGFQNLVDTVYPLLGWVCGFALVALMLFLPGKGKAN